MHFYINLIFCASFCSVIKDVYSINTADPDKTYRQCKCELGHACHVNVSCVHDPDVFWIGVRAMCYGWYNDGQKCSADNSSQVLSPQTVNCTNTTGTLGTVLDSVSGESRAKDKTYIFNKYPANISDYFILNFDCVPFKGDDRGLVIDSMCQNHTTTSKLVKIYNDGYGTLFINNGGVRSCVCTISTNASELILQTYDNRLDVNQTLTLTQPNGTIIKQWKHPVNTTDIISRDIVQVSNSRMSLLWKNRATTVSSETGGKIWVVIKASDADSNITVACQNSSITTTTTTTTTAAATTTTVAVSSDSMQDNFPTTEDLENLNSSTSIQPNKLYSTRIPEEKHDSTAMYRDKSQPPGGSLVLSSTTTTGVEAKDPCDEKDNLPAIIGGAIGCLLFLILLILLCVYCCLKKKRAIEPATVSEQPVNSRFKNTKKTSVEGDTTEVNKVNKEDAGESTGGINSKPVSIHGLPPLPMPGRTGKTDGALPDFRAKPDNRTSNAANDKAGDALFAKLIGDDVEDDRYVSEGRNNTNGHTIGGADDFHGEENEISEHKKKKKKKKKKKRKHQDLEQLNGEDVDQVFGNEEDHIPL